jgi:hypothetical protein
MARRAICESCKSLDVRQLHRRNVLWPGLQFVGSGCGMMSLGALSPSWSSLTPSCYSTGFASAAATGGKTSCSESPPHGPVAASAASVPGSYAPSRPTESTVEGAWQNSTAQANYSPVGTVMVWRTGASGKIPKPAQGAGRRRSCGGSAAAAVWRIRFRKSRAACIGEPITSCTTRRLLPKPKQTTCSWNGCSENFRSAPDIGGRFAVVAFDERAGQPLMPTG